MIKPGFTCYKLWFNTRLPNNKKNSEEGGVLWLKKFMKWLVLMMMVVLAILVQALVKAENSNFFSLSHNHPTSLTHFLHSPPIMSLSPHHDSKFQKRKRRNNRSNIKRDPKVKPNYRSENTTIEKPNPGSENTPTEKPNHGSENTPIEKPNTSSENTPMEKPNLGSEFTEEERKCLEKCVKLFKEGLFIGPRHLDDYDRCIRRCLNQQ